MQRFLQKNRKVKKRYFFKYEINIFHFKEGKKETIRNISMDSRTKVINSVGWIMELGRSLTSRNRRDTRWTRKS